MNAPLSLPSKWSSPPEEVCLALENELYGEVARGHVLYGARVRAIARREGSDDVLFLIESDPPRVADVHLTWMFAGSKKADRPPWPATLLYDSFEAWRAAVRERE